MDNSTLKELLNNYSKKRLLKIRDAENKKSFLFKSHPELQKIEDEINSLCFSKAKMVISGSNNNIDDFINQINILKKEKENIFNKLNINKSYLEPEFDCKLCKDTGYITDNNSTRMCNCLKQHLFNIEYNKSNIGNLDKENFSTFNLNLYSDEINEKKYNSKISPRANLKDIRDACITFVNNVDNPNQKNLLFTGNTGLGKTFLSNCIAKSLLDNGKTVLYQTAPIMLDSIIDYRFGKNYSSKNYYDNLLNVDLLIIDDLGTETMNNLKFTELFNILNSRLLNQNSKSKKTLISTNLSLQNLFSNYDERIVSRIFGYYDRYKFFGEDIRFKKL